MNKNIETQHQLNARYAAAFVPLTITFGLFVVVGVVGNVFILIVFLLGKIYTNSTFRVFVICLGIIDLLTCVILIPSEIIKHRITFAFQSFALCQVKCFFGIWSATAACLCLLVVCVDRFMKVVMPLKKQISSYLAVRLCIFFTIVVPVVLAIPGTIMCGVVSRNKTNVYNTTTEVSVCAFQPRYEKHILWYINNYTFLFLFVGMTVTGCTMYTSIGVNLCKYWNFRPGSERHPVDDAHRGGTRRFPCKVLIWFVLTIVYILTYVVYLALLTVYTEFVFDAVNPEKLGVFLFFYRLHYINNIINPIVYAVFDKRFRKASQNIVFIIRARHP